jgi:hypothetical protein
MGNVSQITIPTLWRPLVDAATSGQLGSGFDDDVSVEVRVVLIVLEVAAVPLFAVAIFVMYQGVEISHPIFRNQSNKTFATLCFAKA